MFRIAIIIIAAMAPFLARAAVPDKTYPPLFGTTEIRSTKLQAFKQWTGAVERYVQERAKGEGNCGAGRINACRYKEWLAFIERTKKKNLDQMSAIKEVNDFVNKSRYITDMVNWNKRDYWNTPGEFLSRNGDCEDHAIAKFMTLRQLGFDGREMRIVAVEDLNLKVGHAILAVYLNGKVFILDNQIKQVVQASTIRHYRPVYSINETDWWRHR